MTGRQDILGEADIVNTRGLWGGLSILGQVQLINVLSLMLELQQ